MERHPQSGDCALDVVLLLSTTQAGQPLRALAPRASTPMSRTRMQYAHSTTRAPSSSVYRPIHIAGVQRLHRSWHPLCSCTPCMVASDPSPPGRGRKAAGSAPHAGTRANSTLRSMTTAHPCYRRVRAPHCHCSLPVRSAPLWAMPHRFYVCAHGRRTPQGEYILEFGIRCREVMMMLMMTMPMSRNVFQVLALSPCSPCCLFGANASCFVW